ncbi:hypothetical protein G7Y79_00020g049370 [Physcia stellaris]|nr:hypothetical protein G7Y79_00020g049370 [Physcia stellaris]
MTSILDLSNEVLDQIIRLVPPFDLQSLADSHKRLDVLAEKALKKHLAFQKKYSFLSFYIDIHNDDTSDPPPYANSYEAKDPLLFLGRIIQDPSIALYPRTVSIGPYIDGQKSRRDHGYQKLVARRKVVIENCSAELMNLFEKCSTISVEEKGRIFDNIVDERYESATIALLITLLPNVTHIASQDWLLDHLSETIKKTVHRIAQSNHDPQSPSHGMALTKLTHFSMSHTGGKIGEDFDAYGPFALLPSMRTLSGDSVEGKGFTWPSGPQTVSSYVTEINITHSAIFPKAFDSLLSRIPALKRFTYTYYSRISAWTEDPITLEFTYAQYDPAACVESLRKYAATSLELLDISSDPEISAVNDHCFSYRGVGSLEMFTSLKEVNLENTMFQNPIFELREALYDEFLYASDDGSWEGREFDTYEELSPTTQRLVDILPASVKSLSLLQTKDGDNMQELFEGLVELKAQKLPKLETIDFRPDNPLNEKTQKALEEAGIILTISDFPDRMTGFHEQAYVH